MQDKKNEKVESEQIWQEIKDLPIDPFGIPGQKVHQFVTVVPIPGDHLLLKLSGGAVLPALENALGKRFRVEVGDGYVMVYRASTKEEEIQKILNKKV